MIRALPILKSPPATTPPPHFPELLSELQALGMRWRDESGLGLARKGGAGPSDHKAVTLGGQTVMVPILTAAAIERDRAVGELAEVDLAGNHVGFDP